MADEPLSRDEELEIVFQMMDGDREALKRLLKAYGPRVKSILLRKYGFILTDHDIEVVLCFAAEKAFRGVGTYDDKKGRLGGWFYRIAYYTAVEMLRDEQGDPDNPTVPLLEEPAAPDEQREADERRPSDDPVIMDLLECIEELGAVQRTIAKADLLAGGEADAEVLAKKLGIPKQHVYSYRNKYHEALEKRMTKRGHAAETIRRRR